MKNYHITLLLFIVTLGVTQAQVRNSDEADFPDNPSEGEWGAYLLRGLGEYRTLRLGVANDNKLRGEIEIENNNQHHSNIYLKTSSSAEDLKTRMVIDPYGKVGIGTGILNAHFNVKGQNAQFYSGTLTNSVRMGRNEDEHFNLRVEDNDGFLDYNQDEDENGDHVFYIRNRAAGTSKNNDIRFQTGNGSSLSTKLTIKENGNIGIGNDMVDPHSKLQMNGELRVNTFVISNEENLASERVSIVAKGETNDKEVGFLITNDGKAKAQFKLAANGHNDSYLAFSTSSGFNNPIEERMRIDKNGNIGIGTTVLNTHFNVQGQNAQFYSGTLTNSVKMGRDEDEHFNLRVEDNDGFLDYNQDEDENGDHVFYIRNRAAGTSKNNDIRFQTGNGSSLSTRLTIKQNGNIGIGNDMIDPQSKLQMNGELKVNTFVISNEENLASERVSIVAKGETNDKEVGFLITNDGKAKAQLKLVANGHNDSYLAFSTSSGFNNPIEERMRIDKYGNIGIGATDLDPNFKLSVNGAIRAKRIKCETGWADFVFDEGYELRSLDEVKKHIIENGHLPEIPSEEEVSKNGIELGEMNAKLLQKIEELTLYLIEENQNNKALNQRVDDLEKQIKTLTEVKE